MVKIQKTEMELLTTPTNFAIVRMPGRKFPGVVFQGDSLFILSKRLEEIYESAQSTQNENLIFSILEIKEQIEDIVKGYESVLTSLGIKIPYDRV